MAKKTRLDSPDFDSWSIQRLVDFLIDRSYPGVTKKELAQLDYHRRLYTIYRADEIVEQTARIIFDLSLGSGDYERKNLIRLCENSLKFVEPSEILVLKEEQMFYNRKESDAGHSEWLAKLHGSDSWKNWLASDNWNEDEAIALSLGKNPQRVHWKAIKSFEGESKFVKEFSDRRKLLRSALRKKILKKPIGPTAFISWCVEKGLDIPEMMTSLLADTETAEAQKKKLTSQYWEELERKITHAIREYPTWRDQQKNIQKTGNVVNWLKSTIKANSRETEIIKKVLTDIYPDLG